MELDDFLVCPESSCNAPDIELDYYSDGEQTFLTFNCTNCIASSAEDDFEWYITCPSCDLDVHERERGEIQHTLDSDGEVTFTCTRCGLTKSTYVTTQWNSD